MKKMSQLCLFAALFLQTFVATYAQAHVGECAKKEGMEQLRCERHAEMAKKCSSIKAEAHYTCDREFLHANPISSTKQTSKTQSACEAREKAYKPCEPKLSGKFMKCVKDAISVSPL